MYSNASGAEMRLTYDEIKVEMEENFALFVENCEWMLKHSPPDTPELVRRVFLSYALILSVHFSNRRPCYSRVQT